MKPIRQCEPTLQLSRRRKEGEGDVVSTIDNASILIYHPPIQRQTGVRLK